MGSPRINSSETLATTNAAMKLTLLIIFLCATVGAAEIIPWDRRIRWVPNETVGIRGGVPTYTGTVRDITQAPYSADNTGVISASSALQTAINNSSGGDIVSIPAGIYRITGGIVHKNGVLVRGAGTNTILVFLGAGGIVMGPTTLNATQGKQVVPTNAALVVKGSTNMTLTSENYTSPIGPTDFGNITAGEMYVLTTLNGEDTNNPAFSVFGWERQRSQAIYIDSRTGKDINFWPPLVKDFTNSPHLLQLVTARGYGMGLENFRMTFKCAGVGTNANSVGDMVFLQGVESCWVRGCEIESGYNYNIHLTAVVNCEISSNTIARQLSGGTSHSGLIVEGSAGNLIQNNIFDTLGFAIQSWGQSAVGNAYFANLFTNIVNAAFFYHNTHHMMDLFEANVLGGTAYWQADGYYGSNGDISLVRNSIPGTVSIKRFTRNMNIVGNVCGSTLYHFGYATGNTHPGATYNLFGLGFPNIGNDSYSGTSPPTAPKFPQTDFTGAQIDVGTYSNVFYKITNVALQSWTTNIAGSDYTYVKGNFMLQHATIGWPHDSTYAGNRYGIIWQDGVNTNKYWKYSDLADPTRQINLGQYPLSNDTVGILIYPAMTVSNGWTMLCTGPDTYQQLQTEDNASHIITGNWVTTNSVYIYATNGYSSGVVSNSYLYTEGPPDWWGTNAWPMTNSLNPSHLRYLGIAGGGGGSPPAPVNTAIISGTVGGSAKF